jgi:hypothetical protein
LSSRQRQWQSSAAALSRYNASFLTEATGGTESSAGSTERKREEEWLSRHQEGKLKGFFCHGRAVQGNRLSFQPEEDERCSRTGGTGNTTFSDLEDEISVSHRSQVGLLMGRSSSLDEDDYYDQQVFLSSSFDGGLDDPCQEDGDKYRYHGSPEWFESPSHELEAISRGMKIPTAFKGCVPSVLKKKKEKKKHGHPASFSVGSMPSIPEWPMQRDHTDTDKPTMDKDGNFIQVKYANEHFEPAYLNNHRGMEEEEEEGVLDIQPFSAYQRRGGPVDVPFANTNERNSRNTFHPANDLPPAYHTEAEFLDTLANDLTLAQNYRNLQQSIQELTGKSSLERILQQQQTMLYHMSQERFNDVPNVVGYGKSEDQSDLVSEVGMASTSGGRYNDNAGLMSALGKTDNRNRYQDYDDYGPFKTKNIGYQDEYTRGDYMRSHRERDVVEGSRHISNRHIPPSIESQDRTKQEFYDRVEDRSTKNNYGSSNGRQRNDHNRQRGLGLVEDEPISGENTVFGKKFFYESYGKSLIDDSFGNEEEFSSPHDRNELIGDRSNIDSIDGIKSFESVDDGPTVARRDNIRPISPTPIRSNEGSIDHMPSPTRVGLKSRPKKSETFEKWREESRSAPAYSGMRDSISSRRQNLVSDNFSDTSSSFSRFSRSSKYRELLGMPYKITKDDRGSSMGSIQTHKWSNTTTVRRNDSRSFMSTHNETTSSSESSDSSVQKNDPSKKFSRVSPHSVVQYDLND